MIKEVSVTIQPEDEKNAGLINHLVVKELQKAGIKADKKEMQLEFVKKSIDARRGNLKYHLKYRVFIGEKPEDFEKKVPLWKKVDERSETVTIIGSGPAGLFAALKLLEYGIRPIILERGCETSQRKKDIAAISTKDLVNENSNYCFGEGGAGTFSDGKLYTRSNKRGNIDGILGILAHFGADKKILTDAHPHIGTDKLPQVINAIRNKIIELGGQFYFNTCVMDFELVPAQKDEFATKADILTKNDFAIKDADDVLEITGVVAKNTLTGEKIGFKTKRVILATGHSASDIYELIAKKAPGALEAKTFAVGVRVEHPRSLIDNIQYHGRTDNMPAAEYRVTAQVEERGVYSFCMCPGGFVVPSASGPDEIVVNGMSASGRNSKWSNAAIVVEIRPEDIPEKHRIEAEKMGCADLAGLLFRTEIERKAKANGKGQAAPAQMMVDFLDNKKSVEFPPTSYTAGIVSSNLKEWMPEIITRRLAEGFLAINKNMKGFVSKQALLIAPETRTSTPVRIVRNKETLECNFIKGLYPAGEGSGYSGGIVSSAMDGEKIAMEIAKSL
ncbi:MAG: FAD-dependent monooxygenase [Treponema sp.]|nr:FAD-dependent monooxygenase [Treponema sp.]